MEKLWIEMTDAEIKVNMGKVVENLDVDEIVIVLTDPENDYRQDSRVFRTFTFYICMERTYSIEVIQNKRVSYKVGQVLGKLDESKLLLTFLQFLKYTVDNFQGTFDTLFQWVAAVADLGCCLSPTSRDTFDITSVEPLIGILNAKDKTADERSHILAYHFVIFLSNLMLKDNPLSTLSLEIEGDPQVTMLFNDLNFDGKSNVVKDKDEIYDNVANSLDITEEELAKLKLQDIPKNIDTFKHFWNSKTEPAKVELALQYFPNFASKNVMAITQNAHIIIDQLLQLDNKFNLNQFDHKREKCIIVALATDVKQCYTLINFFTETPLHFKKVMVVKVLKQFIDRSLSRNFFHCDNNDKNELQQKAARRSMKQLGTVTRKSLALTKNPTSSPKPVKISTSKDFFSHCIQPFSEAVRQLQLDKNSDPILVENILYIFSTIVKNAAFIPEVVDIFEHFYEHAVLIRRNNDFKIKAKTAHFYANLLMMTSNYKQQTQFSVYLKDIKKWSSLMVLASQKDTDIASTKFLTDFDNYVQSLEW